MLHKDSNSLFKGMCCGGRLDMDDRAVSVPAVTAWCSPGPRETSVSVPIACGHLPAPFRPALARLTELPYPRYGALFRFR